jgi:hypothetical protein
MNKDQVKFTIYEMHLEWKVVVDTNKLKNESNKNNSTVDISSL